MTAAAFVAGVIIGAALPRWWRNRCHVRAMRDRLTIYRS